MASAQSDAIPPRNRQHTTNARGVVLASLVGSVMLLLFCARELPGWADRAWPDMSEVAQKVDDTLGRLAGPYEAVHDFMQRFADRKLGG